MSYLEITAVVFSLLCVWLSIRRNVLNWPAGIVAVVAYLFLFYRERLYADMILQVFFMVQGIYGWYYWRASKKKDHQIVVELLNINHRALTLSAILLITFCWAVLLERYTDASIPYVDAFAATTSFFANGLMARKKIESWVLWVIADAVYIGLFWYKELYLSSGIYALFFIMAITGLFEWIRKSTNMVSR